MPLRTLVTGAVGVVGRVLKAGFHDLPVTFSRRTQLDVNDREALRRAMQAHDQVVHLASPLRGERWSKEALSASVRMAGEVLDAARDPDSVVSSCDLVCSARGIADGECFGFAGSGN
jgi:nucleoside-diphosphate-sugar epimerase